MHSMGSGGAILISLSSCNSQRSVRAFCLQKKIWGYWQVFLRRRDDMVTELSTHPPIELFEWSTSVFVWLRSDDGPICQWSQIPKKYISRDRSIALLARDEWNYRSYHVFFFMSNFVGSNKIFERSLGDVSALLFCSTPFLWLFECSPLGRPRHNIFQVVNGLSKPIAYMIRNMRTPISPIPRYLKS